LTILGCYQNGDPFMVDISVPDALKHVLVGVGILYGKVVPGQTTVTFIVRNEGGIDDN
jgi:hypothetical protein